jgi:hypothetical protein
MALHRTGPHDVSCDTSYEVAVGKYDLFMFGSARGADPITNEPYIHYGSGFAVVEIGAGGRPFAVDFWIGD